MATKTCCGAEFDVFAGSLELEKVVAKTCFASKRNLTFAAPRAKQVNAGTRPRRMGGVDLQL